MYSYGMLQIIRGASFVQVDEVATYNSLGFHHFPP